MRSFYLANFWSVIRGDEINNQRVAECLFDFAVNAGHQVAVKLAQIVVGTTPDGQMGPITVQALNRVAPEVFLAQFTLAKMARYRDICLKDRSQTRFLLGWLARALRGLT